MLTGVTGLSAYSSALSVTSSNISNSSTTAYKSSNTEFSTMLSGATSTVNTMGLAVQTEQNVTSQGELTGTTSVTDLAISGSGFFVTSANADGTNIEYTRSGSFTTNDNYQLVNSSGLYLLGYGVTTATNGTTTTGSQLSTITIDKTKGTFQASSAVSLSGNLESDLDVNTTSTADYTKTIDFYDSQGGTQTMTMAFTKSGTNEWSYSITYAGDSANVDNTTLDSGTITFNTDGSLASVTSTNGTVSGANTTFTVPWSSASGLSTTGQTLTLDFGTVGGTDGFTQYATTSNVKGTADGAAYGTVSSYTIGTDGTLSAVYTNGMTRELYKIPVATFANANALTAVTGTAYTVSDESGDAVLVTAGTLGSGDIKSKELENSTVDIATELTDLITTQRAYSACAKIVSTATTMLDVLTNLGS